MNEIITELKLNEFKTVEINNDFFNIFLTKKEFSYLLNFIDYHDLNSFENIKQIEQLNSLKSLKNNLIYKKDKHYQLYKNFANYSNPVINATMFFTFISSITAIILIFKLLY